ncbi:unnamed protein product [Lampetra planeri]
MKLLYLRLTTVLFMDCFINCHAFNLDTDHPIIKEGDEGSLFGFSVALHKQVLPEIKSMLLVGAPQAEGLSRQAARRSGGIYACPITQQPGDCSRLTFDDHVDLIEESKENQWMGVTVRSQGPGGKVLACAHRYERRNFVGNSEEIRSPVGRCYVLGQALGLDPNDHSEGGGWHACSGRGESYALYGFCQQGTAAGFTRDYHYLYFGSPGAHYWRGLVSMSHRNSSLYENGIFDDGPYETVYTTQSENDPEHIKVPLNSYMGFSVDVANDVARRGEASVVAGAPRAAHTGAVLLLAVNHSHNSLVPELMLRGEGLASAYGYAVCLTDLNGDGWMDLLVGAPYFFDQSKKSVGGAVYVYLNDNGRYHPGHGHADSSWGGDEHGGRERRKRVRLEGTAGSGFGLTIAAIGDLDLDSFQDVAVGAPFEESGRVYIYSGGPSGVITKPAQVLAGENLDVGLQGFGYSLSGDLDVDGNLYPDLLVGSLSDQVILFRSRTVITADVRLLTDGDIDVSVKNCENGKSTCVRVLACFSYWARPPTYSPAITLHYSLNAEEGRRQQGLSSRVHFTTIAGTEAGTLLGEHVLSGNVSLDGQGDTRCFNATLRVHDHVKDKLRTIPLHLHYEVQEARWAKSEAATEELLPTLNASVANPLRTEMNFVKEGCGEDKVCQSELSFNFSFCSHIKSENFTQLRSEGGRQLFLVGQHKGLALNVSVRNIGDDAHETHLLLVLPSGLSYRGYRHIWGSSQPLCLLSSNASVVDCELGNPLKRGHQVLLYLILSTEGVTKDTLELSSSLQLTTTSEQEGLEPVIAKVKVLLEMEIVIISTVRPSQAYFGGEIRGESVIWWEGAAGSLVEFNITVLNLGHPLEGLGGAYVDIHFPVEMSNGKWLLYLVALELSGAGVAATGAKWFCIKLPGTHFTDVPIIITSSCKRHTCKHRNKKGIRAQEMSWPVISTNPLLLDCAEGTARCWRYRCPLAALPPPGKQTLAQVELRARLWNSTFLEEYPRAHQVDVVARVHVGFTKPLKNLVIKGAKPEGQPVRVTVLTKTPGPALVTLPWWIILLTVLAGLLLLALLILLLWKCGFFKRTTENMQYETVYHRAHLHLQPSDRQRLGLES